MILSVTIGITALVFLMGFMNSYLDGFSANAIRYDHSHIQLHHPKYLEEQSMDYLIDDAEASLETIRQNPEVLGASGRILASGMLTTSKGQQGIMIAGIDPEAETATTDLGNKVKEGAYFEGVRRNPVLMSRYVADKLGVEVGDKVVLQSQDVHGNITSGSFRVVGLFSTASARYNSGYVFVRQQDMARMVGTENQVHEIAVYLTGNEVLDVTQDALKSEFPTLSVQTWKERAPEILVMEAQSSNSIGIIMLALLFGIINTMMMAVLERFHELGMLMAVGMTKARVFGMIMLETIILSIVGAPVGMAVGSLLIAYLGKVGIDLGGSAETMEKMGFDTVLYPSINAENLIMVAGAIVVTSIIGSIFPAFRAVRLKPVEALRHV